MYHVQLVHCGVVAGLHEVVMVVVAQRLLVPLGQGVALFLAIEPRLMALVVVHRDHTRGLLVGHAPPDVVHVAFLVVLAVRRLEVLEFLDVVDEVGETIVADVAGIAGRLQVWQAGWVTSLTRVVDPNTQQENKNNKNCMVSAKNHRICVKI